jgi:hypothetical protein
MAGGSAPGGAASVVTASAEVPTPAAETAVIMPAAEAAVVTAVVVPATEAAVVVPVMTAVWAWLTIAVGWVPPRVSGAA